MERFIDEKTGKMTISPKMLAVLLEGVWCQSRYSECKMFVRAPSIPGGARYGSSGYPKIVVETLKNEPRDRPMTVSKGGYSNPLEFEFEPHDPADPPGQRRGKVKAAKRVGPKAKASPNPTPRKSRRRCQITGSRSVSLLPTWGSARRSCPWR